MSDFIRRMMSGTLILRAGEGEGGAAQTLTDPPSPEGDGAGGSTSEGTALAEGISPPEGVAPPETPPAPAGEQLTGTQKRMNQLVAERWAERRRAEAAEQQANLLQEQLRQTREALQPRATDADGNPVAPPPTPSATPPVRPLSQQDIERRAAEIASQNEFNSQVAAEVARGRGVYAQDFDQVAANLQRFGELPRTFVEAALATGKGADVIYALGKDTLEADRILSLPPIPQAVALASLAQSLKAPEPPKVVTSAPAPVSPRVGGGKTQNTPSLEDENLSTADWIALREKQLAAQKSSGGRPRR